MRDSGSAVRRPPAAANSSHPAALASSPADALAAIEVRDLRKRYGELEAVRGIDFSRAAAARSSGCSARTARARRRPSRSSRATATRTGGERVGARLRSRRSVRARCASGSASCCRAPACTAHITVREALAPLRRLLPAPARRRRGARAGRPRGEGRRAHAPPLRRPAATARLRARARSATPT